MSWRINRQRDFTGGENLAVLPELMAPNQLLQARNMVMTADGLLETRQGKSKVNNTAGYLGEGPVLSIHRFAKSSGGDKYLVVQHGTSLYAAIWDGDPGNPIQSFTTVRSDLTAGAKLRSVVWKDKLILTNGVDNPFRFDGSSWADLNRTNPDPPPSSKYIKVYGGKLWLVDVDNPNHLRFSGLEDYDSWNQLDVINLRDGDGDVITGLSPQPGGMIITKQKSVWQLFGTNRYDIQIGEAPLSDTVGCVAPDTLLDEGLFLGPDTLYRFTLSGIQRIADTHMKLIEPVNLSMKQDAFAVSIPRESRAVCKVDTTVLNIDGRYQNITTWDSLNASCFAVADAEGDPGCLLIGDLTDGYVYSLTNSTDDDGNNITTVFQTAHRDEGSPRKKVWRYFLPEIDATDEIDAVISLRYDLDNGLTTNAKGIYPEQPNFLEWNEDAWDTAVWGPKLRIKEPYYLHGVRGNSISFTVIASNRIKLLSYLTKFIEAGAI